MSKMYKNTKNFRKCPNRVKDDKASKKIRKEKKKETKNLKRRLRLAKRQKRFRPRVEKRKEEKKCSILWMWLQTDMVCDKNGSFEDENKSKNYLISKGNIRKNGKIKENKINLHKPDKIDNKIQIKNIIIYIELFLIIDIFPILSNIRWCSIEINLSKIAFKIKGTGTKNVLGKDSVGSFPTYYYPNQIYINGELQKKVTYSYNFKQEYNFVELIWYNKLRSCDNMFRNCRDIIEFDFTNFDTSEVTIMRSMFICCSSLTSLNLSNFKTSKVETINWMFYGCSSLTSLNMSNFDISKVTLVNRLFDGCYNLEYINLPNFNENKLTSYSGMFTNIPNNVVICINEKKNKNKIFPQIKNIKCKIIDCSNDWRKNQIKIIQETGECIDSCKDSPKYIYEYNGKCYENCPNGLINDNYANKCKCNDKCLDCSIASSNLYLCITCNNNYYQKENDDLNIDLFINCYKEPKGYYLDNNDTLYKKCYVSCETCEKRGDNITHNCLQCKSDFNISISVNNYSNCYSNCDFYYYIDNENISHCTFSCPEDYPILIEDKKECIKNNIKSTQLIQEKFFSSIASISPSTSNLQYFSSELDSTINKIIETEKLVKFFEIKNMIQDLIANETNIPKEEGVKYYDTILKSIEKSFTSEEYDTYKLDKGENEIIKLNGMTTIFTTLKNLKNYKNNNITSINLGECETLLIHENNITDNQTLYMTIIEVNQEGIKIPKIEYDVYGKLSGNKLEKLNLSICEERKILMSIYVEITDNIDKHNKSSGYYNDICYTATSDYGTDISLKDRRDEYPSKALCQDDCDLINYDYNMKKANCLCDVKQSSFSFAVININKTKLLQNFVDIKNMANINILVCYKELFCKPGILPNIGFYIITLIILLHTVNVVIFY